MALQIGWGISKLADAYQAGRVSALRAKQGIEKNIPNLGILFSSIDFQPQQVLKGIYSVFPEIKIIGSSGAGIITPEGIEKHAVAIIALVSEKMQFTSNVILEEEKINSYAAGYKFARNLLNSFGDNQARDLFLFFSDGIHLNASELVSGIHSVLGNSFPVLGGISSDDLRFQKSFQYLNQEFYQDKCVGLLCKLGNDFSFACRHGWKPLGRPRIVTGARENLILEIENRPAISIYYDYFGQEHIKDLEKGATSLMSLLYPLGIYREGEREYTLRNVIKVKDGRALLCQGNINEGDEVRLMIGNKNSCLEAGRAALVEARNALKTSTPKAAIIFESALRAKLLGRDANQEIALIKDILTDTTPFIGFYTYGEYIPLESSSSHNRPSLHNGMFSVLLLG